MVATAWLACRPSPRHEVQFVYFVYLERRESGSRQLLPHFIDRVSRMKRSDEVALQQRRRTFCMLPDQLHSGLVIRRTQQIDHQHRRARLCAARGGAPERDGIGEMMKQAVANDRVEATGFQFRVWQVSVLQRDARVQSCLRWTISASTLGGGSVSRMMSGFRLMTSSRVG